MTTQKEKENESVSSSPSSPTKEESVGATTSPPSAPSLVFDSLATDATIKEHNGDDCNLMGEGVREGENSADQAAITDDTNISHDEKEEEEEVEQEEQKKHEKSSEGKELVGDDEQSPSKATEEEESPLDEEGLKRDGYDVILVGTGLVQSILASALTRAGKSVLHCDGNDFYGEKDAVFSLGALMEWSKDIREKQQPTGNRENDVRENQHDSDSANDSLVSIPLSSAGALSSIEIQSETNAEASPILEKGMGVVTPYGEGTILHLPAITNTDNCKSLAVELSNWTMADGKSPTAYFGYHGCGQNEAKTSKNEGKRGDNNISNIAAYYAKTHDIIPTSLFQFKKYVLERKRSFALDLTPGLLYASGSAVNGMIESGVSAYCEFKSLLGLHLFIEQQKKKSPKLSKSSTAVAGNSSDSSGYSFELSRVPCSKRDVFQTKLLSPVDKRRLMKFLQIASDYAFAHSDEDNAGAKDENKSTSPTENSHSATAGDRPTQLEEDVVTSLNERQLQQGRSLYRPQNKSVSISDLERLQQCIDDGMGFKEYLETEHKLPPRLRDIVIFAMAMGSSGNHDDEISEPDSYSTRDGMSDLSLHLRSLGKYGGTAFLVPLYGAGELSQAFCRSAAVHGGTYLLRRGVSRVLLERSKDNEQVRGALLSNDSSIHDGEEMRSKEICSRHVVIPSDALSMFNLGTKMQSKVFRRISILRGKLITDSGDDNNTEQRHIIIVPPSTFGNTNVIHGIVLDESVNIAPHYYGESFSTTVLHLTTIVDGKSLQCNDTEDVLQKAVKFFIGSQSDSSKVEEIYHLSFTSNSNNNTLVDSNNHIDGLHICQDHCHSITVESAFREASLLFRKICPNAAFLKLSTEMDDKVKESRAGITEDDEDHDKTMLESAMNMMTSSAIDSDEKE